MGIRGMGKATFLDLRDGSGQLQVHIRRDVLGEDYELVRDLDVGDFLGAKGSLFLTRTGEITVDALEIKFLAKAMRSLPEKWHGLSDVEIRHRQRYLDLITNQVTSDNFRLRSRVIAAMRRFLDALGFLEVETPVLVPVAAGAMAHPFMTHHNALDRDLYLRIATELYLKRLIIGGLDKVYEIGRVFRNEGIDLDHNPEFTLLESYEAYSDYNDVMVIRICFIALEKGEFWIMVKIYPFISKHPPNFINLI
jgi:lysyl-tRNA synthetase class 2